MTRTLQLGSLLVIAALALSLFPTQTTHAQGGLRIGGGTANFGVFDIAGGFMPDPRTWNVTSGGSLAASSVSPSCRGHVSAQPDLIVRYHGPANFVRFFVRAAGDTTLVINDPRGRWFCSDDEGGYPNPMVDFTSPAAGQYDIWVGSYRSGELLPAVVHMTELSGVRP